MGDPADGCRYGYERRTRELEREAVATGMCWNATVRISRLFSQDKPHVETITCLKLRADQVIETRDAADGVRRWVWLNRALALGLKYGRAPQGE
jgi:hypothetical protein